MNTWKPLRHLLALLVATAACTGAPTKSRPPPKSASAAVPTPHAGRRPEPDRPLDPPTRTRVVDSAATKLVAEYVFADVGERMAISLRTRQRAGEYDKVTSSTALAELLTNQLRDICHDKHLHVDFDIDPLPPEGAEREDLSFARAVNYGFEKAERLEGNLGYVEIRGLIHPRMAAPTARAAMAFVADTDALILDLRRNGGGEPEMVALIASYLFDGKPIHLNDLRFRRADRVDASWTVPLEGQRRYGGDKPVYVLTSDQTFSGGEELAYDLQVLRRATIVGEVTRGGANPNERFNLTEHFAISIPVGRAINPMTKTSWEGVGVKPDVAVPAAHALLTAQILALRTQLTKAHDPGTEQYMRDTLGDIEAELDRLKSSH